jgi:hypothetical protein
MHTTRVLPTLFTVTLLAVAGCGSESTSTSISSTSAPPTTAAPTTAPATTAVPTTDAPTSTVVVTTTVSPTSTTDPGTSTTVPVPAQLAIWPATGTVFSTPEAAAADFVDRVLAVPPALGAFEAGDSRSGEIAVYSVGEGGGTGTVERSRLLLRQLGPDDGWFVIAAAHDVSTVVTPAAGTTVPAGPITVAGIGHGFEASMMVSAYVAGDPAPIDAEHTMAGSMEDPGDYSVTLDLTGVAPGTTVMLMVRGGTGLETDPGEFGAIAVTVG